jgi:hypothetical protein
MMQQEKFDSTEIENAAHDGQVHSEHEIDPIAQKRVVRKLDLHIVPLGMALCEYFHYSFIISSKLILKQI